MASTTSIRYYDITPSAYHCYAQGGKGIASHDVFAVMNVVYFNICVVVVVYNFWHSHKIIKRLANVNNNNQELENGSATMNKTKERKRQKLLKFHRESLRLSVVLVVWFLAAWTLLAIHFLMVPFGFTYKWGRSFFWAATVPAYLNSGFNCFIHFALNRDLRKAAMSKIQSFGCGSAISSKSTRRARSSTAASGRSSARTKRGTNPRTKRGTAPHTRFSNAVWHGSMALRSSISGMSDEAIDELLEDKLEDAALLEETVESLKEPQIYSAEESTSIDEGISRHRAFSQSTRR